MLAKGLDEGVHYRDLPLREAAYPPIVAILPIGFDSRWPKTLNENLKLNGKNLCPGTPWHQFGEAPQLALCGGVLLRSNVVVTDRHCIKECLKGCPKGPTGHKVMVGFTKEAYEPSKPPDPAAISKASVCKVGDNDSVLLTLDSPFPDEFVFQGTLASEEDLKTPAPELVAYHYPLSLPLKAGRAVPEPRGLNMPEPHVRMTAFQNSSGGAVLSSEHAILYGIVKGNSMGIAFMNTRCGFEPIVCTPGSSGCPKMELVPAVGFAPDVESCSHVASLSGP